MYITQNQLEKEYLEFLNEILNGSQPHLIDVAVEGLGLIKQDMGTPEKTDLRPIGLSTAEIYGAINNDFAENHGEKNEAMCKLHHIQIGDTRLQERSMQRRDETEKEKNTQLETLTLKERLIYNGALMMAATHCSQKYLSYIEDNTLLGLYANMADAAQKNVVSRLSDFHIERRNNGYQASDTFAKSMQDNIEKLNDELVLQKNNVPTAGALNIPDPQPQVEIAPKATTSSILHKFRKNHIPLTIGELLIQKSLQEIQKANRAAIAEKKQEWKNQFFATLNQNYQDLTKKKLDWLGEAASDLEVIQTGYILSVGERQVKMPKGIELILKGIDKHNDSAYQARSKNPTPSDDAASEFWLLDRTYKCHTLKRAGLTDVEVADYEKPSDRLRGEMLLQSAMQSIDLSLDNTKKILHTNVNLRDDLESFKTELYQQGLFHLYCSEIENKYNTDKENPLYQAAQNAALKAKELVKNGEAEAKDLPLLTRSLHHTLEVMKFPNPDHLQNLNQATIDIMNKKTSWKPIMAGALLVALGVGSLIGAAFATPCPPLSVVLAVIAGFSISYGLKLLATEHKHNLTPFIEEEGKVAHTVKKHYPHF